MEFPLTSLTRGANSSGLATAAGNVRSLLSRRPDVAVPYVAVLGVAAVVGTLGNLAVISGVTVKQVRRRRHRTTAGRCSGGNEAGRAFVVNLALSDLIVATLINPLAIAGLYKKGKVFPYSLPSVGPGADPGVQAVSPQVT